MKKAALGIFFYIAAISLAAEEPFYYFAPPKQWKVVPAEKLAKTTKIAFVANSKKAFKPSINLGVEKISIPLADYLEAVKKQHTVNRKTKWHEVGFLQTKAGRAHIAQIDLKAEYGDIRCIQAILVKEEHAYVMTAVSLREDFLDHYNDFIKAFESFSLAKSTSDSLVSSSLKNSYTTLVDRLNQDLYSCMKKHSLSKEKALNHPSFTKKSWKTFEKALASSFKDQGFMWQWMASKEAKEKLLSSSPEEIAYNKG